MNCKTVDFKRCARIVEHAYTEGLLEKDATVIATLKLLHINKNPLPGNIFKRLATKLAIEPIDPITTNKNIKKYIQFRVSLFTSHTNIKHKIHYASLNNSVWTLMKFTVLRFA